ncbi:MAG: hypothetical protein K5927_06985 [Lachnospiraceae bacterium]|nr:hypothetical protein [Lachnospiraceae bacterium]
MKKSKYKLLFLYAFSALSLCACASSISNDDHSAPESTEISEPASTNEESSVPESATEKFTWPVKETQAEETLPFDLNEKTEYLYTNFYDEPVYDFVPSPDYKAVFPYYGLTTINVYIHDDVETESQPHYSGYGFCNADGAIITEPYYTDVKEDYQGSGSYIVMQMISRYYEDHEVRLNTKKYGLINITGTKYTGCDYTQIMYENEKFYAFKTDDNGISLTIFSKDLDVIKEESPFNLDDDFFITDPEDLIIDYSFIPPLDYIYEGVLSSLFINGFISDDIAIINDHLCDIKKGKVVADYQIVYPGVTPDYNKMLIALCDDGYFCLLNKEGKELTSHFGVVCFNCPLFIARENEFEEYHLINSLGEQLGILPAEAEIVGMGDYFMVKNDNNNFDIYDSEYRLVAENVETNGEYREIFNEDAKTTRCPFVKGKEEGMVIDPLTGNMLYLGSDFFSVYMFGDTYYFKTSKTTLRCDRELNVLDFVDNAIIENFSDLKTGKQYIIANKAEKIKEIRDPDTYALVLTIPSDEFGTVLYDGILGLLYYDDPKTYGVASSRLTRLFPLNDPETIIFKYKENVEYTTRKERAEIITDE